MKSSNRERTCRSYQHQQFHIQILLSGMCVNSPTKEPIAISVANAQLLFIFVNIASSILLGLHRVHFRQARGHQNIHQTFDAKSLLARQLLLLLAHLSCLIVCRGAVPGMVRLSGTHRCGGQVRHHDKNQQK